MRPYKDFIMNALIKTAESFKRVRAGQTEKGRRQLIDYPRPKAGCI